MVTALVAKALHALLDDAKTISLMGMRLKSMAHDVGPVQLDPRAPGQRAELGAVGSKFEVLRDGLHDCPAWYPNAASVAHGGGMAVYSDGR